MRCVHMGSTNKMIARTLGISEGTVKIHLTSIFQQLGASNRAAAVALYNGWMSSHLQVLRKNSDGRGSSGHGASRRDTVAAHRAAAIPVSVAGQRHERAIANGRRTRHALWRHAARRRGAGARYAGLDMPAVAGRIEVQ